LRSFTFLKFPQKNPKNYFLDLGLKKYVGLFLGITMQTALSPLLTTQNTHMGRGDTPREGV